MKVSRKRRYKLILSSASAYQLWQMSRQAGNRQGWLEWSGKASRNNGGNQELVDVPLAGSLLLLEFGRHIPLSNIYESASAFGQFQFQVEVNYTNQGASSVVPELVIIPFYSGVFSTQQGTSSTYTNVLSRSDIMAALEQAPVSMTQYNRMLGSGLWDSIKSAARWIHKQLPQAKKLIQDHIKHPYADKATDILSTLGYGKSGSGLKSRVK